MVSFLIIYLIVSLLIGVVAINKAKRYHSFEDVVAIFTVGPAWPLAFFVTGLEKVFKVEPSLVRIWLTVICSWFLWFYALVLARI